MSNYECACEVNEGESWDWFSTTTPRSKKMRKCCECQDVIQIGEQYERIVAKFYGEMETYITCLFCAEEYKRLGSEVECLPKGELACALALELRGEL